MTQNYLWTDNPTEANVAVYDSDILNECLMHLKYQNTKNSNFCINSASLDASGNPNLLSYSANTVKFNCGNSIAPIMSANSASGWTLSASHPINTSANDIYKSFNNDENTYCSLQHTPTESIPAYITIEQTSNFACDYLYLHFKEIATPGSMKNFYIQDENGNTLYSYENYEGYLKKNSFLIPLNGFIGKKIKVLTKATINNTSYVNFPNVIKLLKSAQIVSATNAQGSNSLFSNIPDLAVTQKNTAAPETQNIYISKNGLPEAIVAPLTRGKTLPTTPTLNQVHYLTVTEPIVAKIYNGTDWVDFNKTPVGSITMTSGNISAIATNPYNQNGYNLNSLTPTALSGNIVTKDTFTQNFATNGWTKLPNGLILQWGTTGGSATVFPIAFPNACLMAVCNLQTSYGDVFNPFHTYITSMYTTGFSRYHYMFGINWMAIGY